MSFLAIIHAVIEVLPLLLQLVTIAENAFPHPGAGAQKLDLVKTALSTAYSTASAGEGVFDQLWPILSNIVGSIVAARKTLAGAATVSPAAVLTIAPAARAALQPFAPAAAAPAPAATIAIEAP